MTYDFRTEPQPGHGLESSRTAGATSGCNQGAAVEADATWLGSSS